jgi:hypothetical protein
MAIVKFEANFVSAVAHIIDPDSTATKAVAGAAFTRQFEALISRAQSALPDSMAPAHGRACVTVAASQSTDSERETLSVMTSAVSVSTLWPSLTQLTQARGKVR